MLAKATWLAEAGLVGSSGRIGRVRASAWVWDFFLVTLQSARRPAKIDLDKRHEVLWYTLLRPPQEFGVTHWSSRLLAKEVGLHHSQVADLGGVGHQAVAGGDVKVLHRPRVGGQGR